MDWQADIDEAIRALKDTAPTLINDVPALAPLAGFLPLLGITLSAVAVVQKVSGHDTVTAVTKVAEHLTPGFNDAGALSSAQAPDADQAAAVALATQAVQTGGN